MYFYNRPHGSKKLFADKVGITQTWLGILINQKGLPSPHLAKKIEKATRGSVKVSDLRPDLFE